MDATNSNNSIDPLYYFPGHIMDHSFLYPTIPPRIREYYSTQPILNHTPAQLERKKQGGFWSAVWKMRYDENNSENAKVSVFVIMEQREVLGSLEYEVYSPLFPDGILLRKFSLIENEPLTKEYLWDHLPSALRY